MATMVPITHYLGSAVFYAMRIIELGESHNTRRCVIQRPPVGAIMLRKTCFW
ncbi:hypothetical protein REPUB_Repub16aG0041900 [Reevesia pubescens]